MANDSLKVFILIGIAYALLVFTALSAIQWNEIEPVRQVAASLR